MALEDMKKEGSPAEVNVEQLETQADPNQLTSNEEEDIRIVSLAGYKALTEMGGLRVIEEAINTSSDPTQVIGQVLAQLLVQIVDTVGKELEVSPRVYLARGGWLDNMLDYIESELGLPSDFSDDMYAETLEAVKARAQSAMNTPPPGAVPEGPGVQGAAPPMEAQPPMGGM